MKPKDPSAVRVGNWNWGKAPRLCLTEILPGIEDIDITVNRLFDRIIGTSLDAYETVILSAITRFLEPRSILEIGTWDGNTALNLAANSPPDARVTTLDLPLDFVPGKSKTRLKTDWRSREDKELLGSWLNITGRDTVGIQYRNTEYEKKIRQAFGDSAAVDWLSLGAPFDLVFIDGCHTYDYVKSDTENSLKHLGPEGAIIWHDYGMLKDVSDVVDETSGKLGVSAVQGTRFAIGITARLREALRLDGLV
ncbi:TPA: class I SAM-dependent methyltransferase [Candidatus Micrarchaeota archaeon]|nr:class I SAM-dependent methyltransferase [Candidatus Micrarchaeota archaeon]